MIETFQSLIVKTRKPTPQLFYLICVTELWGNTLVTATTKNKQYMIILLLICSVYS